MNEQLLNLKFVGEVEKYPLLYDYHLPEYSRKDLVEKAWQKVGKEVNLTVPECKDKWKNLRAVFVRHMKQSIGPGARTKKPYYLAEALQYILPYVKALTTTNQGNQSNLKQEIFIDDSIDGDLQSQDPLEWQTVESAEQVQTTVLSNLVDQECSSTQNKRKRTNDDFDESFSENKRGTMLTTSDDKFKYKRMFLLSLLPELDELNHRQMKIFKRRVLQLVDDILNSEHTEAAGSLTTSLKFSSLESD